jgi:hypothetical protein
MGPSGEIVNSLVQSTWTNELHPCFVVVMILKWWHEQVFQASGHLQNEQLDGQHLLILWLT